MLFIFSILQVDRGERVPIIETVFKLGERQMIKELLFALWVVQVVSISMTVSSAKERCMIVSSNSEEQFLKIDLKFQLFAEQALQEGYRVVLHNTETHQEEAFQVYQGTFRKEFKLTQNVVYRLCFKIVLSRYRVVSKQMEYNAGVMHKFSADESHISIPSNLLKSKDLSDTYTSLTKMKSLVERLKQESGKDREVENFAFETQKGLMETFEWINVVELVAICLFGGYQYYRLKGLIENKQAY